MAFEPEIQLSAVNFGEGFAAVRNRREDSSDSANPVMGAAERKRVPVTEALIASHNVVHFDVIVWHASAQQAADTADVSLHAVDAARFLGGSTHVVTAHHAACPMHLRISNSTSGISTPGRMYSEITSSTRGQ